MDPLHKMYAGVAGYLDPSCTWRSVAEYLSTVDRNTGPNVVFLVGHAALRCAVMGMSACEATTEHIADMTRMTADAMAQGAWGLSTGLTYVPGCFSTTRELVQLTRAVSELGGVYCTHMRDYGARTAEAIEEAASIGRAAGIPVHISHLQTVGPEGKNQSYQILHRLEELRDTGVDITFDSYPYAAGSSSLHALLPAWVQADGYSTMLRRLASERVRSRLRSEMPADSGVWSSTVVRTVASRASQDHVGKTLLDIAKAEGQHPVDVACDLCASNDLMVSQVNFLGNEEDIEVFMRSRLQMFGTDGLHVSGNPHPRLWGTCARVLAVYVRERRVLTLEEAVHKMTGAPANRLGLKDRGLVKQDYAADLVVFDPDTVRDRATFDRGDLPADGISHVFVNGVAALEDGKLTGALPGRVLRR